MHHNQFGYYFYQFSPRQKQPILSAKPKLIQNFLFSSYLSLERKLSKQFKVEFGK